MARDTKSLPLTGKTRIQKRGYQNKFKTEIEFEHFWNGFTTRERAEKRVDVCCGSIKLFDNVNLFLPPLSITQFFLLTILRINIRGN